MLCNSCVNSTLRHCYYHSPDDETKAQKGQVTCPRTDSWWTARARFPWPGTQFSPWEHGASLECSFQVSPAWRSLWIYWCLPRSHHWWTRLQFLLDLAQSRLGLFYGDCNSSLVSCLTSRKTMFCWSSNQSLLQEKLRVKRSWASKGNSNRLQSWMWCARTSHLVSQVRWTWGAGEWCFSAFEGSSG